MSRSLDPIHNIPTEVFELVVAQCQPTDLKQSYLVSPGWCSMVSNSKHFIEALECRYVIIDSSKYNDLHRLDPSKFRKLKVTSKRLVEGKEVKGGSMLMDEHIQQLQKFSPYVTHLELNDMKIYQTLLTLLQFIKDCQNLHSLNLESLKYCLLITRIANPLQQKKIDHVRALDSFSILKHLIGLEINKFEIFGVDKNEATIRDAVDFLNSINVVNEIKCDGGIFFKTKYGELLQPKFKWLKADVIVRKSEVGLPPENIYALATTNFQSIENFMAAADDGAEFSVLAEEEAIPILHSILGILSSCTNIRKLTIGDLVPGNFLNDVYFKRLPRAVGVEHLIAIADGHPNRLGKWPLESLLEFCPNAQTVEITGIDFAMRAEMCLKLMKNLESLSIDSWAENADVGDFIMPKLTHLKIESFKSRELVKMQRFIANNMQLKTLYISKVLRNGDGKMMSENQLKQELTGFNQELEINLENIINL